MNVFASSAIAQNVAGAADSFEEREARVKAAKLQQQRSQMELDEYQNTAANRKTQAELQLEQTQAEVTKLRTERLKNSTYQAFQAYGSDNDVRHLNTFLRSAKSDPVGEKTWGNWSRFDPLTRTPELEAKLAQAGFEDIDEVFNNPELANRYIVGTDFRGDHQLLDLDKLYQATGYTQYMTKQQLEEMRQRAEIENLVMGQQSADSRLIRDMAKENGWTIGEATRRYYEAKNQGRGGSTLERAADDIMRENPSISRTDAIRQATRLTAGPSSAEKDVELTAGIRSQLHELSSTKSFYDADLSTPSARSRAGELITDLEKATGRKLSDQVKVAARNLRSLTALGGKAGTALSDEETGILDNLMYRFKKYISDDVEGVDGVSSYETFRNIFRNSLYGASLTASEIQAFEKAAGNLKQQTGPVLAQLRTQMQDVRQQLRSVADFEDPMMAYYYLGRSQDDVLAAIDQIDKRIELISSYDARRKEGSKLTVEQARKTAPAVPAIQPLAPGQLPTVPATERFKQLTGGAN